MAHNSEHSTAILYLRVSTGRQAEQGMSLDDQENRLRLQAEALGFSQVQIMREEGRSGGSMKRRPVLAQAREMLAAGQASALIATKLDRVSRNARDVLELSDDANRQGWRLIVLDVSLDTGSPMGRAMLTMVAAFAELERNRIAERQSESQAERRRQGQIWGVTHGPRSSLPQEVRRRIIEERSAGRSLQAIATALNTDRVPTARGGSEWRPSTIAHLLRSPATEALA